jgi:hypothetical protein
LWKTSNRTKQQQQQQQAAVHLLASTRALPSASRCTPLRQALALCWGSSTALDRLYLYCWVCLVLLALQVLLRPGHPGLVLVLVLVQGQGQHQLQQRRWLLMALQQNKRTSRSSCCCMAHSQHHRNASSSNSSSSRLCFQPTLQDKP